MRTRRRYLVLLIVVALIAVLVARSWLRGPTIKAGSYLVLEVDGAYEEAPPPDLMGRLLRRRERTLIELVTMIRKAQVDERIKGVIARIGPLDTGWAKVQDMRDALRAFKNSGKPLVALLENADPQQRWGPALRPHSGSGPDRYR
ncbi:MAG: hypothetical protein LAO55_13340 [Acidobacteriia bacterium]|nr:hypothetical protein [Terriglobia bacterium]